MTTARAGVVVTGTEVLTGIITDRNGPWLSERLRDAGVDVAQIVVVGDRPADVLGALRYLAAEGADLIITSGGLGPTADDLTAEVVAGFQGRPMALDEALEERIHESLARRWSRWRRYEANREASRAGIRKQARVPEGADVIEPVGTAPGLVVTPAAGEGPVVAVLPGPPMELQGMWDAVLATEPVQAVLARTAGLEQRFRRLFGLPESIIAETLRDFASDGVAMGDLEITTCQRRGELEIATVFAPAAEAEYDAFVDAIRARHGNELFSEDRTTIDEIVAGLLQGRTIAVAESCTGGLMTGRLTDLAGSSAYVMGGVVVYSNEAKTAFADVPPEMIAEHGAVSPEVARALAQGALHRFGTDVGVGITGIAGPGGGSEEKPVGTVCLAVASADGGLEESTVHLPGDRALVRSLTTTLTMHMLRARLLAM
jgi:nicotinamide-nucleotide amidase